MDCRFLISSEVKCAHFHGTEVAKPIPSCQVYKGTVFALVDQAVDFVLSQIALSVGTRAESVQAPVAYEIPKEVVTESIVNAVGPPGLHGQQQRAGHALRGSFGSHEFRPTAAAAHGGEAARRAPVATRESAAGGVHVSAPVYRTDGNRNGGHDPALRRSRLAGAGVRRQRRLRHDNSKSRIHGATGRHPGPRTRKRANRDDGCRGGSQAVFGDCPGNYPRNTRDYPGNYPRTHPRLATRGFQAYSPGIGGAHRNLPGRNQVPPDQAPQGGPDPPCGSDEEGSLGSHRRW